MPQPTNLSVAASWIGSLFICLTAAVLSACNAPRAELAEYHRNFDAVRASSEQYILEGKRDARALADSPHQTDSPSERAKKLAERLDVLDARLDALDAITAYNDGLEALIANSDPAVVASSFRSFGNSLAKLAPSLSKFAGPAAPAVDGVAAIVSAIEDAARLRRFRDAVAEAEKVLPSIFDLLAADIQSLSQVRVAFALAGQSDAQRRVQKASGRAASVLNGYVAAPEVQAGFARINAARARVTSPAPLPALSHAPRTTAAGAMIPMWSADSSDAVLFAVAADEADAAAAEWERVMTKARRVEELRLAYVHQMESTKQAFAVLAAASRSPSADSINWQTAAGLAADSIRRFREARLALDEVQ